MMQRKLAASKTKAFPYMNPSTARKSPRRRSLTNSSAAIKLEQHTHLWKHPMVTTSPLWVSLIAR